MAAILWEELVNEDGLLPRSLLHVTETHRRRLTSRGIPYRKLAT